MYGCQFFCASSENEPKFRVGFVLVGTTLPIFVRIPTLVCFYWHSHVSLLLSTLLLVASDNEPEALLLLVVNPPFKPPKDLPGYGL
eukprot:2306832-Rhodomonas_salina.1